MATGGTPLVNLDEQTQRERKRFSIDVWVMGDLGLDSRRANGNTFPSVVYS